MALASMPVTCFACSTQSPGFPGRELWWQCSVHPVHPRYSRISTGNHSIWSTCHAHSYHTSLLEFWSRSKYRVCGNCHNNGCQRIMPFSIQVLMSATWLRSMRHQQTQCRQGFDKYLCIGVCLLGTLRPPCWMKPRMKDHMEKESQPSQLRPDPGWPCS